MSYIATRGESVSLESCNALVPINEVAHIYKDVNGGRELWVYGRKSSVPRRTDGGE